MPRRPALPKDPSQRAKALLDMAVGQPRGKSQAKPQESAAATLGRLGGLKGGNSRAKKLSAEQRSEIARHAAAVRYGKKT